MNERQIGQLTTEETRELIKRLWVELPDDDQEELLVELEELTNAD